MNNSGALTTSGAIQDDTAGNGDQSPGEFRNVDRRGGRHAEP